jgi:protein O-GlcNAcase/histone acetyltransferase
MSSGFWGVVEGFYGRPWTMDQRAELCRWMARSGLDSYLYAPKDDPKHRLYWSRCYTDGESEELAALIRRCRRTGIRFIYGLAPGYRAEFSPRQMERMLRTKVAQLLSLGCQDFALLFDDIPPEGSVEHLRQYGSWAGAHITWTHQVLAQLRRQSNPGGLLFCPTPYCGSFAGEISKNAYLQEIGHRLDPDIPVFWTGQDIVAQRITVAELRQLRAVLRRPPILWDNLFANDYDLRRLYLGPYQDREPGIRQEVSGILLNPNCEFRANYVPLHTFASFVGQGRGWTASKAYRAALQDWRPSFRDLQGSLPSLDELRLLTDSLHLPYEVGDEAVGFLADVRQLLASGGKASRTVEERFRQRSDVLTRWHTRITDLADRELSYTLYRHVWELKEEVDLLQRYLAWQKLPPRGRNPFRSIFHQPGTYRGGFAAELQRLLALSADGNFEPAGC